MDISNCTALVTGANRGLGREFSLELLKRGARVYGGARNPDSVDVDGVVPLAVDITDPASVTAAMEAAGDVTLLINNAGIAADVNLLTGDLEGAHREMATNYFGTLAMVRAFAPVIERNGGGGILNVLSVLSWVSYPDLSGYCASKSAAWSMTNAVRVPLAERGVVVTALHVGLMDTDMAAGLDGPKSSPADVASRALDAVAAGDYEVLADDVSRSVRAGLVEGVTALYPQLATGAR
ncbi:SDR family oxidoreductase [Mycolicibacterium sp. 050158]|uniref:SDR family oxidoreductase n=1 Tax=Mycolicibacterium sp. 050158 TaxID=3090602 RepID=UPI00299D97E3|nr:SDR family oxidoreductase [Mycolicibacterium sp. 050158]MDX1891468.1 SDR family oxidoreductase [Mycolicibacterium sp. 050158]